MSISKIKGERIALFCFDIDGVLTDGRLYYGKNGEDDGLKVFNAQDGLGLSLLKKGGVALAAISGRRTKATEQRLSDLGIEYIFLGVKDKKTVLIQLMETLNISSNHVAFMGDDLIDLPAMQISGLSIAPQNAVEEIKSLADIVTQRSGGEGAIREATNFIFAINDQSPLSLLDQFIEQ